MDNNEIVDRPATNADELFAKVTAAEKATARTSTEELDLGAALALYERCIGIMIEATVIDLTTEQRAELNERMDKVNTGLQQSAMTEFMD
jgi:hypothetical protein